MAPSRFPSVPKAMQARFDAIVVLTDAVCRDHLDGKYRHLARAMAAALCRKRPSPLASGQPRTWACGILHVLGQLNVLSDEGTTLTCYPAVATQIPPSPATRVGNTLIWQSVFTPAPLRRS